MKQLFSQLKSFELPLLKLAILALFVGLFYSRALISIAMIVMLCNAIINQGPKQIKEALKRDYWLLGYIVMFGVYLLSGLYSGNINEWWKQIMIKLPLLALPLALAPYNRGVSLRSNKWMVSLLALFFLFTALPMLLEFYSSYDEVLKKYAQGQTLFTPISHVRYSLIMSFGVFLSLHGFLGLANKVSAMGLLYILLSFSLFVVIHVLAVRSGLVCLYAGLGLYAFIYFIRNPNWRYALTILGLVFVALYFSPKIFPTIEKKMGYTLYSIEKYQKNEVEHYSDTKRWISIKVGWALFKKAPFFGVGAGDVRDNVKEIYRDLYPSLTLKQQLMPHNQYLRIANAIGLIGLLIFLWLMLYPLFIVDVKLNALFFVFIFSTSVSFLVEGTIENQIGTAYFVFIAIWLYLSRVQK